MEVYTELMIKKAKYKLLYVDSFTMSKIFYNNEISTEDFKNGMKNLERYKGFLSYVNIDDNHWIFLYFNCNTNTLMYLDPFGIDEDSNSEIIAENLFQYFTKRNELLNLNNTLNKIVPKTVSHSLQQDGYNCGICSLLYMKKLVSKLESGKKPNFKKLDFSEKKLAEKRMKIARKIERSGMPKCMFCTRCGAESAQLIPCSNPRCGRSHCIRCPFLVNGLCQLCLSINLNSFDLEPAQEEIVWYLLNINASTQLSRRDLEKALKNDNTNFELVQALLNKKSIDFDISFIKNISNGKVKSKMHRNSIVDSSDRCKIKSLKSDNHETDKTNKKKIFKRKSSKVEVTSPRKVKRSVEQEPSSFSGKHQNITCKTNKKDTADVKQCKIKDYIPEVKKLCQKEMIPLPITTDIELAEIRGSFNKTQIAEKTDKHKLKQKIDQKFAGLPKRIWLSSDKEETANTRSSATSLLTKDKEINRFNTLESNKLKKVQQLQKIKESFTVKLPKKRKTSVKCPHIEQKKKKLDVKHEVSQEKLHNTNNNEKCAPITNTSLPVKKDIKANNSPCKLDEAQLVEPKKLKNSNPVVPHNNIKFHVKHEESQTKLSGATKTGKKTKKLLQNQNNYEGISQKNETHENNEVPKTYKKSKSPRKEKSTFEPLMTRRIQQFFDYETFNFRTRRQLVCDFIN